MHEPSHVPANIAAPPNVDRDGRARRWRDSFIAPRPHGCGRNSHIFGRALAMTGHHSRILLVEDNEDNMLIYSTILRHFEFEVIEARDGCAGVDAAKREAPDLILMDVSIPLIDGWEATRRLKANPATCDIPVIAFTAHILPSDLDRALAAGCATVIAKPFEIDVFLAQITALLDQHSRVRSRRVGA